MSGERPDNAVFLNFDGIPSFYDCEEQTSLTNVIAWKEIK